MCEGGSDSEKKSGSSTYALHVFEGMRGHRMAHRFSEGPYSKVQKIKLGTGQIPKPYQVLVSSKHPKIWRDKGVS